MRSSDRIHVACEAVPTERTLQTRRAVGDETAKSRFKARTQGWAERLDVSITSITVRPLTTKWASCSTSGRLTFDSQLLEFSSDLQDYVIVHELLHFSTPNHGRLWKSLMRAHLGNYEAYESELRSVAQRRSLR